MDYNNYYNPYMYNGNPYFNPRQIQQTTQPQQWANPVLPKMEIIKVHGEEGAKSFQMAANSQALLLDESNPIVWLVTTDGAGYKTATPFDIRPHEDASKKDNETTLIDLKDRVEKLERTVNDYVKSNTGLTIEEKSNVTANERKNK